jgi:predicted transcriptional regulator
MEDLKFLCRNRNIEMFILLSSGNSMKESRNGSLLSYSHSCNVLKLFKDFGLIEKEFVIKKTHQFVLTDKGKMLVQYLKNIESWNSTIL